MDEHDVVERAGGDQEDVEFAELRADEDEEEDVDDEAEEEDEQEGNENDEAVIDGGVVIANSDTSRLDQLDHADRSNPPTRSVDCPLVCLLSFLHYRFACKYSKPSCTKFFL